MSTMSDFRAWVESKIQDDDEVLSHTAGGEVDEFVDEAVKDYSKDRPLEKLWTETGDGSYDYAVPADWKEGFSTIDKIEYPAGDQIPDYIDTDDWIIYRKATGYVLRFKADTPTASETFAATYTTLHTVTDSASTVYEEDEQAVASLAASKACKALAAKCAQQSELGVGASVVGWQEKISRYESLAERYEKEYEIHIGAYEEGPKPAAAIGEVDAAFSWGEDYLIHPRKQR